MSASNESGLATAPERRLWKWLLAAFLLAALAGALAWAARSLTASRLDRWHPGRSGDVVVLEKLMSGSPGAEEYALRVRLEVPAASPADADLVPPTVEGRVELLGPRTFEMEVPVDREKWDAVAPGARLRAVYHLNVRRSDAFVASLYLDTFGATQESR
jgi:hypothetical protein